MADFTKPSAPKLLGSRGALSMVLGEACFLKSRALMEVGRGRAAVRFSKEPTDFPGEPSRIILNKGKTVNDRVFSGKSSIPLPLPKAQNQLTNTGFFHSEVCVSGTWGNASLEELDRTTFPCIRKATHKREMRGWGPERGARG